MRFGFCSFSSSSSASRSARSPPQTYDAISYAIAADAVSTGHDVYAATQRYNYSPIWSFVIATLWRVTGGDRMRFVLLVGLLLNDDGVAEALQTSSTASG